MSLTGDVGRFDNSNAATDGLGNTYPQEEFREQIEKLKQESASFYKHACPNCGYCPHCGRSGYWGQPYPYLPTYPQIVPYPYNPWITTTTITYGNYEGPTNAAT